MTHLVIGGSASGKSTFAESIVSRLPGPRYYIATMEPWDAECRARIEKHRRQRAHLGFETVEHYGDLQSLTLPRRGTVLLECMGNLTANVLFGSQKVDNPLPAVQRGLESLIGQCDHLVVVTNDVFADGRTYDDSTMAYLDLLAALNRHMAARFDHVFEVVCGIPLCRKGELP